MGEIDTVSIAIGQGTLVAVHGVSCLNKSLAKGATREYCVPEAFRERNQPTCHKVGHLVAGTRSDRIAFLSGAGASVSRKAPELQQSITTFCSISAPD